MLESPNAPCTFSVDVPETREDSKESNMADGSAIKVYSDGSGIKGMGAAAVMYRDGTWVWSLQYCLGSLKEHNTYEAEAVSVVLSLKLIEKERGGTSVTIYCSP